MLTQKYKLPRFRRKKMVKNALNFGSEVQKETAQYANEPRANMTEALDRNEST